MPSQLGLLTNLQKLTLFTNQFTGSLPSTVGNLLSLTWLSLWSIRLSGSLPSQLGLLTNLQGLSLYTNQFTSAVPASFCDFSTSIKLLLQSNPGLTCLPSCLTNPPDTHLNTTRTAVCGTAADSEVAPPLLLQALLLQMVEEEQIRRPNAIEAAKSLTAMFEAMGGDPRIDPSAPEFNLIEQIEDRIKATIRRRAISGGRPSSTGSSVSVARPARLLVAPTSSTGKGSL